MKSKLLLLLTLFLTLNSCKKGNNPPPTPLIEAWPQDWIFTVDANPDKYTYIEINGNNTKRSEVLKSYNLITLAEDNDCEFRVNTSRTEAGDVCWTIQLEKDKKRWLFAGLSPNKQEVHLGVTNGNSETMSPGDSDNYKFKIHKLDDEDGVTTVAIESVEKPGYYISNQQPGFEYSPTQTTLTKESGPEQATHWRCR